MGMISLCERHRFYDSPSTSIANLPTNAVKPVQNRMCPATTSGIDITSFKVCTVCLENIPRSDGEMTKTVALEWDAFMRGDVCPKEVTVAVIPAVAAGVLIGISSLPTAHAGIMTGKIVHAFSPLIQVMQALSYPVTFMGMAAGMLLISVGQRHRGIGMIKWAAIGYIGMQLVPGIMEMVSQVGDAMK
jgi:hypothetical protein